MGPDYIDPAFHAAATGRQSFNLDSWAMPPSLLDALLREGAAHADLLVIEGAMGLFDGIPAAPRRSGATADLAARFGSAGAARRRCRGAIAIGGGAGARLRLARPGGADRRDRAQPRRQRAASEARGRRHRGARIFRSSALFRATRRSPCPSAISAWCRLSSMETLPRGSSAWRKWPRRHLDLDAIQALAVPPRLSTSSARRRPCQPPGQRIALAQDAAFSFVYPHILDGLAAGRGRDRHLLAARRRAAAGDLRQLLASRRIP